MGERFLGEIREFGEPSNSGTGAPDGWAPCDGRLLSVADHPALYGALGTEYGGDGHRWFALPTLTQTDAVSTRYMMYLDPRPAEPEAARRAQEPPGSDTAAASRGVDGGTARPRD